MPYAGRRTGGPRLAPVRLAAPAPNGKGPAAAVAAGAASQGGDCIRADGAVGASQLTKAGPARTRRGAGSAS